MKRSIVILLVIALMLAFNSHGQETAKKGRKAKAGSAMRMPNFAYEAGYSSNFSMGNPEHAAMVLTLYKNFEAKDWSNDAWFADTVTVINADGTTTRGKEQVMEMFKKYRDALSNVSFKMAAFMPLKSVDRNENWVALWGEQSVTMSENNQSSAFDFQAIWRINRDGKVDFIKFHEAKLAQEGGQ